MIQVQSALALAFNGNDWCRDAGAVVSLSTPPRDCPPKSYMPAHALSRPAHLFCRYGLWTPMVTGARLEL